MDLDETLGQSVEWAHACSADRRLLQTLKRLFQKHPELLTFLFDRRQARLNAAPEVILERAQGMSSGERILVRIALDLWNSSGETNLLDPIERLDRDNFENFISALHLLRHDSSL